MPRIPFSEWPQIRILIADHWELTEQGFACATEEDIKNTIICFTCFNIGERFDNKSHKYGPVSFDLDIAFIDENNRIMNIEIMEAETGESSPVPKGAKLVAEAKKGWFKSKGLTPGSLFPYQI